MDKQIKVRLGKRRGMACLEEKDNKEDEKKSHSNVIDAIEAAKKLGSRRLDLSRRCITEIPSELNSLQKLEFLYLEGNSLIHLQDDFFTYLPHLKWLDLRNNQVSQLPSTIGESRNLRSLLLEDNQISKLPLELGFVQSLSGLHLSGNPLEFPPHNITEQGTQVILAFLRDEWLKVNKEDKILDVPRNGDAATSKDNAVTNAQGERIRVIVGQNTHALERRSSDPGSFSVINSPFEDERGILAIQSSVLSSHSGVKKKSFSAGKERKDRGSSSSTAKGKDSLKNIEKRKKNKTDLWTHSMKRVGTSFFKKNSVDSKMQEEMKRAEERIRNAKIDSVIQQRKNKEEMEGWRKETLKLQRQKNMTAARHGSKYAPSLPPFGTHDQKFIASSKHGQQVENALENLDSDALSKLIRNKDIFERIDDHMKRLRKKDGHVDKISPSEEVEIARKNLEEALKLRSELDEKKALEYRLRAFTADDYAPQSHKNK